jgi:hypothetical protein
MDIKSTLHVVCKKITKDRSVDDKVRDRRLKGLIILGDYFVQHGGNITDGISHLKGKLHDQMEAAAKAAMHEDEQEKEKQEKTHNSSSDKEAGAKSAGAEAKETATTSNTPAAADAKYETDNID